MWNFSQRIGNICCMHPALSATVEEPLNRSSFVFLSILSVHYFLSCAAHLSRRIFFINSFFFLFFIGVSLRKSCIALDLGRSHLLLLCCCSVLASGVCKKDGSVTSKFGFIAHGLMRCDKKLNFSCSCFLFFIVLM